MPVLWVQLAKLEASLYLSLGVRGLDALSRRLAKGEQMSLLEVKAYLNMHRRRQKEHLRSKRRLSASQRAERHRGDRDTHAGKGDGELEEGETVLEDGGDEGEGTLEGDEEGEGTLEDEISFRDRKIMPPNTLTGTEEGNRGGRRTSARKEEERAVNELAALPVARPSNSPVRRASSISDEVLRKFLAKGPGSAASAGVLDGTAELEVLAGVSERCRAFQEKWANFRNEMQTIRAEMQSSLLTGKASRDPSVLLGQGIAGGNGLREGGSRLLPMHMNRRSSAPAAMGTLEEMTAPCCPVHPISSSVQSVPSAVSPCCVHGGGGGGRGVEACAFSFNKTLLVEETAVLGPVESRAPAYRHSAGAVLFPKAGVQSQLRHPNEDLSAEAGAVRQVRALEALQKTIEHCESAIDSLQRRRAKSRDRERAERQMRRPRRAPKGNEGVPGPSLRRGDCAEDENAEEEEEDEALEILADRLSILKGEKEKDREASSPHRRAAKGMKTKGRGRLSPRTHPERQKYPVSGPSLPPSPSSSPLRKSKNGRSSHSRPHPEKGLTVQGSKNRSKEKGTETTSEAMERMHAAAKIYAHGPMSSQSLQFPGGPLPFEDDDNIPNRSRRADGRGKTERNPMEAPQLSDGQGSPLRAAGSPSSSPSPDLPILHGEGWGEGGTSPLPHPRDAFALPFPYPPSSRRGGGEGSPFSRRGPHPHHSGGRGDPFSSNAYPHSRRSFRPSPRGGGQSQLHPSYGGAYRGDRSHRWQGSRSPFSARRNDREGAGPSYPNQYGGNPLDSLPGVPWECADWGPAMKDFAFPDSSPADACPGWDGQKDSQGNAGRPPSSRRRRSSSPGRRSTAMSRERERMPVGGDGSLVPPPPPHSHQGRGVGEGEDSTAAEAEAEKERSSRGGKESRRSRAGTGTGEEQQHAILERLANLENQLGSTLAALTKYSPPQTVTVSVANPQQTLPTAASQPPPSPSGPTSPISPPMLPPVQLPPSALQQHPSNQTVQLQPQTFSIPTPTVRRTNPMAASHGPIQAPPVSNFSASNLSNPHLLVQHFQALGLQQQQQQASSQSPYMQAQRQPAAMQTGGARTPTHGQQMQPMQQPMQTFP
uniref:Uncharacterized protein n=1 Tax=Chromera velia CCMP2878 TaxID=1169474 RepID=A0A0G4F6W4_9ALVE|eukprot:Cvel_15495.t1-p1 / transcript=Cvel_15495.t1 / gene=Cvel_15495 / organism=Chromera_velia_CCMP2878 / gene_product=hypothetical protein / transcript_product=hypothetical protein / location=Cvel_scaffold1150:317-6276(+) / protein_length=1101 / sequence_SO=supercontig / SO=protein_coding / is_pseudo=false